ncbi:MAG TPA: L-threonylcarbamoyladenylate synthase [Acidimicrobiia bacterium]|nr:L-threonylcarbamoyladenylate synthase [Acidimicrobiia bacterium]
MNDYAAAAAGLRAGRIVGVPTDTVYGIAAHPELGTAVAQLFVLKGRLPTKPIGVLVASLVEAENLGLFTPAARRLAARYWPGPLTLVVRALVSLPEWVGDPLTSTVGIRVPHHPVTQALLEVSGPIAVTSANRSGHLPALDHVAAETEFGNRVAIYLEGRCPGGISSTVVDATGAWPAVLRPGPVVLDDADLAS